jgi:nucleoside-diphosphate-sugar epimerase
LCRQQAGFRFHEWDLCEDSPPGLPEFDQVFHLAGEPGVRGSWGAGFPAYVRNNVVATQRLLEIARDRGVTSFVLASSSSVYGSSGPHASQESDSPRPSSPYAVTKLAAEHLCLSYCRTFNVPAIVLRYFTVYGPRQRPDMAFSRFIAALAAGKPISVYGDGTQTRDFTFVEDAVEATVAAATKAVPGDILNVAGLRPTSLNDAIGLLAEIMGRAATIEYGPTALGDVEATAADLRLSRGRLGYLPSASLAEGLRRQVEWTHSHAVP